MTGDSDGARAVSAVSLTAKDVHVSFGRNQVLRGADLHVEKGRTACLIGPSGSGKSTFLRTLNRLIEPDSGDILLDGESVLPRDPDELRRQIGMVFQQFNLFPHLSVLRNLTLPLRRIKKLSADEAAARAHHHLSRVGLAAKANARPSHLSGGQQQRVAIARALAMEPTLMLFDEVTSALDPELVKEVLAVLTDLSSQGMTMVVVTHEMNFARKAAHTITFLDSGKTLESAPPAQLFDTPTSPRLKSFLSAVL